MTEDEIIPPAVEELVTKFIDTFKNGMHEIATELGRQADMMNDIDITLGKMGSFMDAQSTGITLDGDIGTSTENNIDVSLTGDIGVTKN